MHDNGSEWRFQLFVAGDSPQSRKSIADLRNMIETYGNERADFTVVDLFEDPDVAIEKDILAIPTLIRDSPPPSLRIIGDLSNGERVWSMVSA